MARALYLESGGDPHVTQAMLAVSRLDDDVWKKLEADNR